MAVEVKIEEGKSVLRDYPYLGKHISTAQIVYFTNSRTGVALLNKFPSAYCAGTLKDDWHENHFTPLSPSESITLRNV